MKLLRGIVENRFFQGFILAVIVFNSVIVGLQTSQLAMAKCGRLLGVLDQVCLAIFVIELVLELIVYNWRFPRDGWNIFDFLVVSVSFVPDMGMLSSARILRVLRVLKLISGVKQMRVILSAITKAISGIMWSAILLLLFYYVYGIIGTVLFGKVFPDWFGSLGASVYSLFQIMTIESWSMGIARPVIAVFPFAWIYFVSYILIASFVVMNIVLNSINESLSEDGESANDDMASMEAEFETFLRKASRSKRSVFQRLRPSRTRCFEHLLPMIYPQYNEGKPTQVPMTLFDSSATKRRTGPPAAQPPPSRKPPLSPLPPQAPSSRRPSPFVRRRCRSGRNRRRPS